MTYKKKVTMKDIAEKSGVSITSVSMILNHQKNVSFSAETVQKVIYAAKTLGYVSKKPLIEEVQNIPAVGASANIIAVFCPNISNAYYSTIVQSIEQETYLKNYKVFILTTYRDKKIEREMLTEMLNIHVSGIIFTMIPADLEFAEQVSQSIPMVIIGDKNAFPGIDIIETSNYQAGVLLAEHLYELGHRHITFISTTLGPDRFFSMRYHRLKGIQDTFRKLSLNEPYRIFVEEAQIAPDSERSNLSLEYDVGYQLCNQCLKKQKRDGITAFVGVNDVVCYGIMDALLKKGYEIPYDFSVCGFDNDFSSKLLPISLTSVEHYMEDKGKKAVEILHQKINTIDGVYKKNSKFIIKMEYQSKLIIRDSTAAIKRTSGQNR